MATKPRILVSLDDEDIREIDALVSARHYDSRSQFARLAIRTYLANKKHMLVEKGHGTNTNTISPTILSS